MTRYELADVDGATLALLNANGLDASGEGLFELGMMYASGRSVPADLVQAHKWFNLAAQKGHADAARMRREIACEMTDGEIGQAQRAARDWLKRHAEPASAPQLRAAA
jgi:uncharacterized protein